MTISEYKELKARADDKITTKKLRDKTCLRIKGSTTTIGSGKHHLVNFDAHRIDFSLIQLRWSKMAWVLQLSLIVVVKTLDGRIADMQLSQVINITSCQWIWRYTAAKKCTVSFSCSASRLNILFRQWDYTVCAPVERWSTAIQWIHLLN